MRLILACILLLSGCGEQRTLYEDAKMPIIFSNGKSFEKRERWGEYKRGQHIMIKSGLPKRQYSYILLHEFAHLVADRSNYDRDTIRALYDALQLIEPVKYRGITHKRISEW